LRLRALLGHSFRLLSGDDATAPAFLALGGDGCISVTSNVAPGLCNAMYSAWKEGFNARAHELAAVAARLTAALFRESNPVPVKYALSLMKLIPPRVRLPLVELKSESRVEIGAALAQLWAQHPAYLIGMPALQHRNVAPRQAVAVAS
jgi:4-hydroxy-tetrahydrodipicolinate synthase